MIVSTPADEARHDAWENEWFNESWYFDFANDNGVGGYVRLGLVPNKGVAWYWAYLVSPEFGLVAVRDHEVPLPKGKALEVRADSLWAECVCETPMEHWGLGLESFGVRLDDPADAYRGERGERIAVGLDLEWEAMTPVYDYPYPDGHLGAHYEHAGVVHGKLLVDDAEIPFEGTGERDHSWGERDWWVLGWHWTSFRIGDSMAINFVQPQGFDVALGYIRRPGEDLEPVTTARVETHFGAEKIPTAARYVINNDLEVDVEVLAAAPVPLIAGDGRTGRFPRCLCRYTTAEGSGVGWAEWNQVGEPVE